MSKKLKAEPKPTNPLTRELVIAIRLNEHEMAVIEAMAAKHTGRNISDWVRSAATRWTPKKEDLT